MGAHHFDIAQWALGMDESGPVKIVPPEDEKATQGLTFTYANGVVMTHGGPSGCTFSADPGWTSPIGTVLYSRYSAPICTRPTWMPSGAVIPLPG